MVIKGCGWWDVGSLALAKGDKGKGEIRSKAREVTGVVADALTIDSLTKRCGAYGGWMMAAEKVVSCRLVGLIWTVVWKPSLSTYMSVSRKVTWKGEMVQVNRTG